MMEIEIKRQALLLLAALLVQADGKGKIILLHASSYIAKTN